MGRYIENLIIQQIGCQYPATKSIRAFRSNEQVQAPTPVATHHQRLAAVLALRLPFRGRGEPVSVAPTVYFARPEDQR